MASKVVKTSAVAPSVTKAMDGKKTKVKKVKVKIKKSSVSRAQLTVPMYDVKGAKRGTFTLPKEIFGAKINDALMAQAVRVFLANQRLGTAVTKTRAEVVGSTRKIYRQKGTGGARHGSKSAPIFVKGGTAHGPKLRDYSLNMPQKMRRSALISALSLKASEGDIKVISGVSKIEAKTKNMSKLISKIIQDSSKGGSASGRKKATRVLLVASANTKELPNVYRASGNIKNVEIMNAKLLNTYEVLKHKNLLIMKESMEVLGGSAKSRQTR